jgi:hypothetical protein
LGIELVLCLFWQKDYVSKMAAEEPSDAPVVEPLTCPLDRETIAQQIQKSMMEVVQNSVDSIFIEGKNSVDTPTKLGRPRKDGSPLKPKLTKQDRNNICSEFVSKLEKDIVEAIEQFDLMKLVDKRIDRENLFIKGEKEYKPIKDIKFVDSEIETLTIKDIKFVDAEIETLKYDNAELKKKNVEFEMEIEGLKKKIIIQEKKFEKIYKAVNGDSNLEFFSRSESAQTDPNPVDLGSHYPEN